MDRKELAVVLLLAALVVLAATVRIFSTPLTTSSRAASPTGATRTEGRGSSKAGTPTERPARALWSPPRERYLPRGRRARTLFDAAEFIFERGLFEAATEGVSSEALFESAASIYRRLREDYLGEPVAEVALLRIAQCYTVVKRHPEASRAYDLFLERYPKSEFRPMALLWSGDSHAQVGNVKLARERLAEVIARHPNTLLAKEARLRLARLGARGSPPRDATKKERRQK